MTRASLVDIEETVEILKQLDVESLLILSYGARILKIKQDMEQSSNEDMHPRAAV